MSSHSSFCPGIATMQNCIFFLRKHIWKCTDNVNESVLYLKQDCSFHGVMKCEMKSAQELLWCELWLLIVDYWSLISSFWHFYLCCLSFGNCLWIFISFSDILIPGRIHNTNSWLLSLNRNFWSMILYHSKFAIYIAFWNLQKKLQFASFSFFTFFYFSLPPHFTALHSSWVVVARPSALICARSYSQWALVFDLW